MPQSRIAVGGDATEWTEAAAILQNPFLRRFGHGAMATLFEIVCVHEDENYARQAADRAFDLLDRIEGELSRFVDNSDIARINHLPQGGVARIGRWTMECLMLARWGLDATNGAFDISLGTGLRELEMHPLAYEVRARASGIHLDLGGIGKGYAVDRMAEVMEEWGVEQTLIHGGCSSVRAMETAPEERGWPLRIAAAGRDASQVQEYLASRCAWSASGLQKGSHVLDPRSGRPASLRQAAWVKAEIDALRPVYRELGAIGQCGECVSASPAAVAEMFSTACLVLGGEEIDLCRQRLAGLEIWLAGQEDRATSDRHSLVHLS